MTIPALTIAALRLTVRWEHYHYISPMSSVSTGRSLYRWFLCPHYSGVTNIQPSHHHNPHNQTGHNYNGADGDLNNKSNNSQANNRNNNN